MKKTITLALILALAQATEVARADFTFGTASNLGPLVNSPAYDERPSISADGLTLYFNSNMPGGYGDFDLWMTTRPTTDSPWGQPENLGSMVNSPAREQTPSISADGLSLYFNSTRPGGHGPALWGDIWVSKRITTSDPWGDPVNLGPIVNRTPHVYGPSISYDGLSLLFGSNMVGGHGGDDIWVSTRISTGDTWSIPMNLGPTVNSSAHEGVPSISADGLALFFSGYAFGPYRSGGHGNADLWMTTRPSVYDPWREPVNLGPNINTSSFDFFPSISADGSTIYFMSDRSGGYGNWDLWESPIIRILDFNGDGIVDSADMCMMVDSWGTDEPLCDIGPMPWGDGVIDVEDVRVLAAHLFEDVNDPTLVAHWALDETEGMTAQDSVNGRLDWLVGDPLWQPNGGLVNGALELDGVDDCIITGSVIDPAEGPFSVLAWIKGGAPGQTIVAQQVVADWLTLDSEGKLVTELKGFGRSSAFLSSEAIVTDGQWHRIGLAWDGSQRTLYVDGLPVGTDTRDGLEASYRGLYIGAGKNYPSGAFFSGLIDDVRIYSRVVKP